MKAINLRVLFFCDVVAVSSDTRIKKLTLRIKSQETTATHSYRLLDGKKNISFHPIKRIDFNSFRN